MTESTIADSDSPERRVPSLRDLFVHFFLISIVGFGGVLPFMHRMVVERQQWLTQQQFAEMLAFSQFLPGGNVLNFAVVLGQRFHGARGSVVGVVALLLAPTLIVLLLGVAYLRYGQFPIIYDALGGVTAAAAGLILAIALKMAQPLFSREAALSLGCAVLVFAGVGLLRLPLAAVVLVMAPVSIAIAWWRVR